MAVEAVDAEALVRSQRKAVSNFFGTEIPQPGDWLFEVAKKIRKEDLFQIELFYLPRRQLAESLSFPGMKKPLGSWLYTQIKAGTVDADVVWLPGEWVVFDVTKRPNYKEGKQMYSDTRQFREMLATLREQGEILVPDFCRHVPKDSRFAISADEVDGSSAVVAKAVAGVLGLEAEQVSTPLYSTFNYIGNLAHPEFGQVDTAEWFKNNFERGYRLGGGRSDYGGLSYVYYWLSDGRYDDIGFRLQISSPSKA